MSAHGQTAVCGTHANAATHSLSKPDDGRGEVMQRHGIVERVCPRDSARLAATASLCGSTRA
jgi:hypothetical protein